MNHKELQDLIKLISKTNLTEFKMSKGDMKISIRTKKFYKNAGTQPSVVHVPAAAPSAVPAPVVQSAPAAPAPAPAPAPAVETTAADTEKAQEAPAAASSASLVEIKSPIVGTFYRSASPEKPPFLKVGDRVEVGDVVCIVEAMKLFNEIESEISGEVVKVFAEDASPVEYDQPLFLIDTSK